MRKLFAIFLICAVLLYSILLCYADEPVLIQKDLPLAMKYETKQMQVQLGDFETKAKAMLAEQQLNIDILNSIYYMGHAYSGSFDGISLGRAMNWMESFSLDSPLYKSEIYKGYFKLRTDKLLTQYGASQAFDYGAFVIAPRQEFDNYMKTAMKSEAERLKLVVLLQEKLMDKLVELEPSKRKAALDDIYALRLPGNSSLCQDYLYQAFEYGVRVEVLNQMLEINKEKLQKLTHDAAIRITADISGELSLQYKTSNGDIETLQILNTASEGQGYSGLTVLNELYGKEGSYFTFRDNDGYLSSLDMNRALGAISLDGNGYFQLKLDNLLGQGKLEDIGQNESKAEADKETKLKEQIKFLEASYNAKTVEAQGIVKELNRYSMYLELKNKGINNYFTRKFEADKKSWKAALEGRLNRFGSGGMADFAAYIKQFVLASRSELGQSDNGRLLTARFRNSIVQFRQPDDSSLWITDMLYNLKYIK